MFVFFHVGEDIAQPTAMVFSIRAHNPDATIIQVTDDTTPAVPGVSRVFVTQGNRQYLMQWRTNAFAELGLTEPAMYMDTDMIVRHPISPSALLKGWGPVAMTRREFNRDAIFNPRQRGQDYSDYAGRTLDSVYPFVGCCTITSDWAIWETLADMYNALPERFRVWYGDQEVLREYAEQVPVQCLPESHYACLPEYLAQHPDPAIVHYKGHRKLLMFSDTARA
jgi:hypothetical protein